jgi:hypothetical protein
MTRFFNDYQTNKADDVEYKYDYNELVTREYKLYENYIVFKQTAPFWDIPTIGSGQDESIVYARFAGSDFSVTQEEYEQLISSYKKVVEYELLRAKYKFEQRGVDIEQVLVQGNWKFINFIKDYIKDIFKINVEDSIV